MKRKAAGHRRPTDQRWEAARDATPNDVLRGAPLQPERVNPDVEHVRAQCEGSGQPVDEIAEPQRRRDPQDHSEHCRTQRTDGMPWQRTTTGTPHPFVDVSVEHAVDGVGAGRGQTAADHGGQHDLERRNSICREKHRRHGGHQEELDDSRLGEPQICGGNMANTGQLTAAANYSHPKINTGHAAIVGGHPTWRVDARHRLHSLTV